MVDGQRLENGWSGDLSAVQRRTKRYHLRGLAFPSTGTVHVLYLHWYSRQQQGIGEQIWGILTERFQGNVGFHKRPRFFEAPSNPTVHQFHHQPPTISYAAKTENVSTLQQ